MQNKPKNSNALRLALISGIAKAAFQLSIALAVIFGVWAVVRGFAGWPRTAFFVSLAVIVISKIVESWTRLTVAKMH